MTKIGKDEKRRDVSRRGFLKAGGVMAVVAGGATAGCGGAAQMMESSPSNPPGPEATETAQEDGTPRISRTRILGRTEFEVSDISMGCSAIQDGNVVRYAYDHGINLFDAAETYGNGDSERRIGEAMPHMDRSKIFLVTKLHLKDEDNEQTVLDRFAMCQERLNTEYLDALYMHSVSDPKDVKNPGFHSAVTKLKADGRLKHAGVSCHGPRQKESPSMSEVLLAAVDDGRFDLMLLVHNFLKPEEGERVLAACAEKNIGTVGMKITAGQICVEPFDPDNPSQDCAYRIETLMKRRRKTREEAVANILERIQESAEDIEKDRLVMEAFQAKYGVKTQAEVDKAAVSWVLENPAVHSACVSLPTFDKADQYLPISGKRLTARARTLLRDYELVFGTAYCRHGCNSCASVCPHDVPVSTVMRYCYYFAKQGLEKRAMQKYAKLIGRDGSRCIDCDAPCQRGCPYGFQVQASLIKADRLLRIG